jgi:hypothetical protein
MNSTASPAVSFYRVLGRREYLEDGREVPVISGAHVIFYSRDAEAGRAFLWDTFGFASVAGIHGWLIGPSPPKHATAHGQR